MPLHLEKFTENLFYKRVWTDSFMEDIKAIGGVPDHVIRKIKEPTDFFPRQINEHTDALVNFLTMLSEKLPPKEKTNLEKLINDKIDSHREDFINARVKQCQTNILNYLKMQYGKTEEVIHDKATKLDESTYEDFLKKHKVVVLDFWAPWCAPCISIGPVINQLAEMYEGKAGIAKINIDENPNLVKKYKISSIPTLVFIKEGKVETQLVGPHPLEVLKNNVARLF